MLKEQLHLSLALTKLVKLRYIIRNDLTVGLYESLLKSRTVP
jgi:hypothetical protein